MKIQIENKQTRHKIERRKIRSAVTRIFKILGCTDQHISILFTDDEQIREINRRYLGKDKATNVISFSMREGEYGHINPQILGDVVISVETARRDAIREKLTLEEEIDFLLIHGILHLLGYNHENTSRKEAKIMYDKERDVFRQMNSRKNMPAQ